MNRNRLKTYAPKARRDFIRAVTDRAAVYGLTEKQIEPITEKGDVAIIAGRAFPASVAKKRKLLEDRICRQGFEQTMEAMAYIWFNRFVAIRFMELHGYLDHGYRVLSPSPSGRGRGEGGSGQSEADMPEILKHAEHVDLPGIDKNKVIELKLDAGKENELYRMLLVAQCNALSAAMPFLFERIDDETELLLPDNLLHTDSLIRQLVGEIDEEDWQEVEIIGWLYQFYISEKKDEVIGKVVKSEDIPAATQLFTPNWIVKYLVQNSLGRQWMATYPDSPLKARMEYYIEPAEQTVEVQAQLDAITPKSLNPEELTLLDPACGSGHILVEAYDLMKAIYQERGYRAKDIPRLILEKNLFGLEIDDRAAQLASFALMMKARADDRTIFSPRLLGEGQGVRAEVSCIQPNILAFQDSRGMDAADITHALNSPINKEDTPPSEYLFEEIEDANTPLFSKQQLVEKGHVSQADITALLELFENAKTFGSLIQIPPRLTAKLPEVEQRLELVLKHGDLTHASAGVLKPFLMQARLLSQQYDTVVANPPYIGSKFHIPLLKKFLREYYSGYDKDLFSAFIDRNLAFSKPYGHLGFMSPFVWMFISSHEYLRTRLVSHESITSLIQLEYSGFEGATVPICSFTLQKGHTADHKGCYIRLSDFRGSDNQGPKVLEAIRNRRCGWFFEVAQDEFEKIPGRPIAYWLPQQAIAAYESGDSFGKVCHGQPGLQTSNNALFVRQWYEVSFETIGFGCDSNESARSLGRRWYPYLKGGDFRKWYGNQSEVVDWEDDGARIKKYITAKYPYLNGNIDYVVKDRGFYFRRLISYTKITSARFSARASDVGFLFDVAGSSVFPDCRDYELILGFLCSALTDLFVKAQNPTLNIQSGDIANLPFNPRCLENNRQPIILIVKTAIEYSRTDWNNFETSSDFCSQPLLRAGLKGETLAASWKVWCDQCDTAVRRMQELETENNRLFMEAYGLLGLMSPDVPDDQITLYRPSREEDVNRLLSYAVGCMMGRYSLDEPGVIYAHSGNEGFDGAKYQKFPADEDGIIPLTEFPWFPDDAACRFETFIATAWPAETLEENLKFVAESLGPNKNEQPRETIRRYLATGFFKHHLKMYKKRPIYWLFSSGRERAFQCLVYLHRYNEGTLSRMRTEYVIPLQGKISARIDQLADDIEAAASTSHRSKLTKERDKLIKHQAELQKFDEKLRHYADQRIALDLDDGVKVNYAKFGELLAEVKAITGGTGEE